MDWSDEVFDGVVSIGCLHHTGNIYKAVSEIYRVLKPGGQALVMLYNEEGKKNVDRNTQGEDAPFTEYTSIAKAMNLFSNWGSCTVSVENGEYQDIYIEAVK